MNLSTIAAEFEKRGTPRVVVLGSLINHGAGLGVRARLTIELMERFGFDVLALPGSAYSYHKVSKALAAGTSPAEACIAPQWTNQECAAVFRVATDQGRCIAGMGGFLTAQAHAATFADDVATFLQALSIEVRPGDRKLLGTLASLAVGNGAATPPPQDAVEVATRLRTELRESPADIHEPLRDLRHVFERTLLTISERGVYPDRLAADGILHLARERFPERRIVVWLENYHLLCRLWLGGDVAWPWDTVTAGDLLVEAMGDSVYRVPLLSYARWMPTGTDTVQPMEPPSGDLLEARLHHEVHTDAFLPLARGGRLKAQPIEFVPPLETDWSQAADAFLYVDQGEAPHPLA